MKLKKNPSSNLSTNKKSQLQRKLKQKLTRKAVPHIDEAFFSSPYHATYDATFQK
jgi:hypothetical protein